MGVPKQLEKASREADELYQKTYATGEDPGEGETVTDPATPAATPAADTPPATAEPPAAPVAPAGDETFEQRWKTLQGMYKADIEKANATINDLRQALEDTTKKLRDGATVPPADDGASEPATPPANVAEGRARIKEEYGQEFLDDMHGEITSPLKSEIAELKKQIADVSQVTHQGANEKFVDALRQAVPDQEALVQDPEFKAWLQQPDEMSGIRRFDLAKDAEAKRDVTRLAKFYNQFKQERGNGSPAPAAAESGAAGSPPAAEPSAPSKDDLLAPGSTGGTAQPVGDGEVEYVKTSEMERFSRDVLAGKFRGRAEEQAEIQKKIDLAQASRRVIVDT